MKTLFRDGDLSEWFRQREAAIRKEIQNMTAELFSSDEKTIVNNLAAKHSVSTPALVKVSQTVLKEEIGEWRIRTTLNVPFTGNAELLYLRANAYDLSSPSAKVGHAVLSFIHEGTKDLNPAEVQHLFSREVERVEDRLRYTKAGVVSFNARLPAFIEEAIATRKATIKKLGDLGEIRA